MRLLRADVDDLVLESVPDGSKRYAILSHRWFEEHEEVTFADTANPESGTDYRLKRGWQKLKWCKEQAVRDGLQYIWADTACIDKSSSQELTESINSMFRWYQEAQCCYVYLHDMPEPAAKEETDLPDARSADDNENARPKMARRYSQSDSADPLAGWSVRAFEDCEWFNRAWTLQELIAPAVTRFYSQAWTCIGDLQSLAHVVSAITRIDVEILQKTDPLEASSIAQKFSWAAGRRATKIEDRAYSLLGVMGVSLTIIYGEGERAFQRLQDELLRTTVDDSIFAFPSRRGYYPRSGPSNLEERIAPLLADDLDDFARCGEIALGKPNSFRPVAREVGFRMRIIGKQSTTSLTGWLFGSSTKNDLKHSRSQRTQAVFHCFDRRRPAAIMVLNFFKSRRFAYDVLYIHASWPRIEMLSIAQLRRTRCPEVDFSIIRNAEQLYASIGPKERTTIFFETDPGLKLEYDKSDPDADWYPMEQTLVIYRHWYEIDGNREIADTAASSIQGEEKYDFQAVVSHRGKPVTTMTVLSNIKTMDLSLENQFFCLASWMKFSSAAYIDRLYDETKTGHVLLSGYWRMFYPLSDDYIALRTGSRFLIAHVAKRGVLGDRTAYFVRIRQIGPLHLSWFAMLWTALILINRVLSIVSLCMVMFSLSTIFVILSLESLKQWLRNEEPSLRTIYRNARRTKKAKLARDAAASAREERDSRVNGYFEGSRAGAGRSAGSGARNTTPLS